MKKKDIIYALIVLLIIGFGVWRSKQQTYNFKDVRIMLDTVIEVNYTSKNKKSLIDSTFALIKNYEQKLSAYVKNSEVSNINSSSDSVFTLSPDLQAMLIFTESLNKKSQGKYDIAIGNLIDLWDFEEQKVPTQTALDSALAISGSNLINLKASKLTKINPKVKINLGSIAKGYIIDKAIDFLAKNKVETAVINAGGDLRIYNSKNPKNKTQIGIQHPRNKGELIDTLFVKSKAIVTSGDYERFFVKNGKRYHHILNPESGLPVTNTVSVTVLADNAMLADALSTACFAMQPTKAIDLVKTYPNTEAMIFYQKDNEIICLKSQGMREYLNEE